MRALLPLLLSALATPSISQTTFKIVLDWDNTDCAVGACWLNVYRATCVTACPDYTKNPAAFTALPNNATSGASYIVETANPSGSAHYNFTDLPDSTAPPLNYLTTYVYAVTNSYANTSTASLPAQISLTTPGPHAAIVNWSSAACRTSSPCTFQVYRAVCTSAASCPAYTPGGSAWTALPASGLTTTQGAQGTSWQYQDQSAALVGNTTYAWVSTATYTGGTVASPPSSAFIGTTANQ